MAKSKDSLTSVVSESLKKSFDIDAFKNVLSTKYMNLFNIANSYSDNIKSLAAIVNFIDEKS